jgi:hypothetical protein
MEHLDRHPHAYIIDKTVVNVLVFAEHDEELINRIKTEQGYDEVICCCNVGIIPAPDWTWDGTDFYPPNTESFSDIPI